MILAAAVLAVVLAILWMSREVDRLRRIRDLNAPPPTTTNSNANAFPPPGAESISAQARGQA